MGVPCWPTNPRTEYKTRKVERTRSHLSSQNWQIIGMRWFHVQISFISYLHGYRDLLMCLGFELYLDFGLFCAISFSRISWEHVPSLQLVASLAFLLLIGIRMGRSKGQSLACLLKNLKFKIELLIFLIQNFEYGRLGADRWTSPFSFLTVHRWS